MSDEETEAWIRRMQRRLNLSDDQVERVDFGEEEGESIEVAVHRGDPGIQAEQQIVNLLNDFKGYVRDFWSNYESGLSGFRNTMDSQSEAAARPQHLQAVFKALAKRALDQALSQVSTRLGPWGEIVGVIKTVAEAWVAESERARVAAGEVRVRDYVESILHGISGKRDAMIRAIEARQRPLIEEFQRRAAGDVGGGEAGSGGAIVGESARVLNQLRSDVAAFRQAIPSNSRFQHLFTRAFADTPGWTAPLNQGARLAGTIQIAARLELTRGTPNRWTVDRVASNWELVTTAPNPDRLVDSLVHTLGSRKVWQIELPKMVELRIDIEDYEHNYMPQGFVRFEDDPGRFEIRTNGSPEWLRKAWEEGPLRERVLRVNALRHA